MDGREGLKEKKLTYKQCKQILMECASVILSETTKLPRGEEAYEIYKRVKERQKYAELCARLYGAKHDKVCAKNLQRVAKLLYKRI